jgi:hypothetical protein
MHPRPAHVRIDEQHTLPRLRERLRQVARHDRLALPRARARHDHRAQPLLRGGEEHVRADGPKRLAERRGHAARQQQRALLLTLCRRDDRHHAQERQAQRPHLVGVLDAAVNVLEHEGAAETHDGAAEEREEEVQPRARARLPARHLGAVDDAHVRRPQLARDPRLLRPLEQALVDLAVALGIPEQHAVVDALPVERERLLASALSSDATRLRSCASADW